MTQYRKGRPGDMEDILDFANYVFSQAHTPHDFMTLIPKVYGRGHSCEDFHYLAMEDHRIKGMVAAYPHTYTVAGIPLNTRFIGTVSVHPYARGKGYMKQLMKNVKEDMIHDGVDIAFLGGQRQRYQYFGYEIGGTTVQMQLSKTNFRHALKDHDDLISLLPVEAEDTELIEELYGYYTQRTIQGRSLDEFYECMCNWRSTPYAVIQDTTCIGYLCVSEDGSAIHEVELSDPSLLPYVLRAHMQQHSIDEVQIFVAPYEVEKIRILEPIAERTSLIENEQFQIFNYSKVLKALLTLKATHTRLEDGDFVLGISENGRFHIHVQEQKVTVTETDEAPDWCLSSLEAVRKLTTPQLLYQPPQDIVLPRGWFPLSFCMAALDGF